MAAAGSLSRGVSPLTTGPTSPVVVRVEPRSDWVELLLGEIWGHRELLYLLFWRDVKIRTE
jgi:hypothetical protein